MRLTLLSLTTLLIAACSGSGAAAAASSTHSRTQQLTLQVYQRYSQCVRDHGVPDWPNPIYLDNGNVDFPGSTPGLSHLPQAARDACDAVLNDLPADARIGQPSARPDVPLLVRFSQCMRTHGLPEWPDPDAAGTFHLPLDLLEKNGPRQAEFLSARQACAHYNPSGQLQLAGR
jgi:hypothetical protein